MLGLLGLVGIGRGILGVGAMGRSVSVVVPPIFTASRMAPGIPKEGGAATFPSCVVIPGPVAIAAPITAGAGEAGVGEGIVSVTVLTIPSLVKVLVVVIIAIEAMGIEPESGMGRICVWLIEIAVNPPLPGHTSTYDVTTTVVYTSPPPPPPKFKEAGAGVGNGVGFGAAAGVRTREKGHHVVYKDIVSVVKDPMRAGQLVIVGAQEVMV